MATSTNSEIVNLAASGMRRAISIRTPRQAYHPLATMTSSRLRYPTGCWVGPNSWMRTPKTTLFFSWMYKLKN
jgi:hypothetical protein